MSIVSGFSRFAIIIIALASVSAFAAESEKAEEIQAPPAEDVSYALGYNLGASLKTRGFETDIDALLDGLQDSLTGKTGRVSPEQVTQVLSDYYSLDRRRQKAAEINQNTVETERFLKQNAVRKGVTVLESGLQYEVLASGDGPSPRPEDVVVIHQVAKRLDGFSIANSHESGVPVRHPVNHALPGVSEALQKMSAGDHWRLFIPPELGFGMKGKPPLARGPVVLIWEVELLRFEDPEQPDIKISE